MKQNKRYTLLSALGAVVLLLLTFGIPALSSYLNWETVQKEFFNVKLFELVQLFAVLVVAGYISYIVSARTGAHSRRIDFTRQIVSEFIDHIDDINKSVQEYQTAPRQRKRWSETILFQFKTGSRLLDSMAELEKEKLLLPSRALEYFWDYKRSVTEEIPGTKALNEATLNKIIMAHGMLRSELIALCVRLTIS